MTKENYIKDNDKNYGEEINLEIWNVKKLKETVIKSNNVLNRRNKGFRRQKRAHCQSKYYYG